VFVSIYACEAMGKFGIVARITENKYEFGFALAPRVFKDGLIAAFADKSLWKLKDRRLPTPP